MTSPGSEVSAEYSDSAIPERRLMPSPPKIHKGGKGRGGGNGKKGGKGRGRGRR